LEVFRRFRDGASDERAANKYRNPRDFSAQIVGSDLLQPN
jgi:hypothetical protein